MAVPTAATLTAGAVIGTATATLYTAPAGVHARIGAAVFTNATSAATTLSVSVARSGNTPLLAINATTLAANAAYVSPELAGLVLNPGDSVTATATVAASVNAQISGLTF